MISWLSAIVGGLIFNPLYLIFNYPGSGHVTIQEIEAIIAATPVTLRDPDARLVSDSPISLLFEFASQYLLATGCEDGTIALFRLP